MDNIESGKDMNNYQLIHRDINLYHPLVKARIP